MRMMILVATVLGAACGPNFTGRFTGNVGSATSCDDGSGGLDNRTTTIDLTEAGAVLTISLHGQCDPLSARLAGNVATLMPKTCPPQTAAGITLRAAIASGTLTLNEPNLAFSMRSNAVFSDGVNTLTCSVDNNGSLVRER